MRLGGERSLSCEECFITAKNRMPEEFYEVVSGHLPPAEPVRSCGARPRIPHRIVMNVLWYESPRDLSADAKP